MKELIGTWKLESYITEDLETRQKSYPYGLHPSGYLSYGPDWRMYAIIVGDNRNAPAGRIATNTENIELFSGLAAYAGSYSTDGDRVCHHVDISWNQTWTGTTQVRQFKIEGKSLHIRTNAENPLTGRESSYQLKWSKVE